MPPQTVVTLWGADPLYKTVPTGAADSSSASPFKSAAAVVKGLTLEELENTEITVCAASFPVHDESDRNLWYADLKIDLGSLHYPFIRLALARYQPDSILGCELSRVVLADFVQLAPDRVATVIRTKPADMPRNPANFQDTPTYSPANAVVTVSGRTYATAAQNGPAIYVTLEYKEYGSNLWLPAATDRYGEPVSVRLALPQPGAAVVSPSFLAWGSPLDADSQLKLSATASYRVIVREYEAFDRGQVTAQQGQSAPEDKMAVPDPAIHGWRLVYAAAVEVWTPS
jgi:hypothetical protein